MPRILDNGVDNSVADIIMVAMEEAGYAAQEAIPGMVLAIIDTAREQLGPDAEQALDEAAALLADVEL